LDAALAAAQELAGIRDSSGSRALLGAIHVQRGEMAEGLAQMRAAIEMDPYLATAWLPYLHTLINMGDLDAARREHERAVGLLPETPDLLVVKGRLLLASDRLVEAESALREALKRNAETPMANETLGALYAQKGDQMTAERYYLAEVEILPDSLSSRRALVGLYANQRRYDEQLAQLEVVMALEPPAPLSHQSRAQALFNLGRYEEAKEWVDQCRALAPTFPGCAMLEANVLSKLGDEVGAQEAYRRALLLAGQTPDP
jgi:tetratricopeptide (TPR) repeat protein